MAIFKRNRPQPKKQTEEQQPIVEQLPEFDAKPVLSYDEAEPQAPKDPEQELAGEVDSLSGIFTAAQTAVPVRQSSLAAENLTASQSRWYNRRKKAMELAKEEAKKEQELASAPAAEGPFAVQSVEEANNAEIPQEKPQTVAPAKRRSQGPVSLSFADLSERTDLDPIEIDLATDIYGIKYPKGFDTSRVNYNGRAIDFSDFSQVEKLRWEHIQNASDISGVIFPSSFDIENANLFDRSLRSCDFSNVYALKWKHIEPASDIIAVKYPATFDISQANFASRNISGSDFSLISALKWEHIVAASDISGIKYPASFDIDGADFSNRNISGSDFSLVEGLRFEHICHASDISGIIFPAGFDMLNADFTDMDISGCDFTRLTSFNPRAIENAGSIRAIKYPDCFDAARSRFDGKNISSSNFSRVSTLRFEHIKSAEDISKIIYPPQFDIDAADFTGLDIDLSDFSLLPSFRWEAVHLAASREGVVYPRNFQEPNPSLEEIEGAMIIFLIKLHRRVVKRELERSKLYADIAALYPGVDDTKAAELIDEATRIWEQPNGRKVIEVTAREAHVGDKLYMLKLGFKLLYGVYGAEKTAQELRRSFDPIFKKHEKDRLDKRIEDLLKGKYLSLQEQEEIGFVRVPEPKTERQVAVSEQPEQVYTESYINTDIIPEALPVQPTEAENSGKVHSFGYVDVSTLSAPEDRPFIVPDEPVPAPAPVLTVEPELAPLVTPRNAEPVLYPAVSEIVEELAEPEQPAEQPVIDDRFTAKPVDLSRLRQQRLGAEQAGTAARKERLSDEEKAIRTGVMGMLLYIHRSTSDEEMTNAELFSEFMKIYPGAAPKEVAAMAQFATNTLDGTDAETKSKLFMFATKASATVKRKLLDFAYGEYVYRLSETADEEIFREFILALCNTLYDNSPEYEYAAYLRTRDILQNPPLEREARYKRIDFEHGIGRANLYANARFPFYRTLEQVGFSNFSFDAIKGNLLIEVSDSKCYEELESLVWREKRPELLQFVIIDTSMGYLYLEQRCLTDWGVNEREVWAAAERNMRSIKLKAKYSFASSESTSFRYIQHDLASYALCKSDFLKELSCGQDLIFSVPCREIVYVDFYDFAAIKRLLEFSSRYDCTLMINGDEYEHPFSGDVFIYHAADGSFERVNDETYILLGDSVARKQVLRSVLPLDIEFSEEMLTAPRNTDETEMTTEEQCVIQEAVFTILRLYAELNGDSDYTTPQNAMMAVVDELFISFDAVYPQQKGRDRSDPLEHIDEAARMASKGGKTLCWLMIQAIQHLCGDVRFETPSAARLRETVLEEIYHENANAVWLSCATATDFEKRFDAVKPFFEQPVDNNRLSILDSRLEVAMHVLTMMFHQFGHYYALGEVRRHIYRTMPDTVFCYEINQSAWLPSPGEDIDVDAQSVGMIFRGFDRSTQERLLTAFAEAVGDRDLAEGGWALLYFIKFVKYAYLDPVEMIERYFIRRSRLIPAQTVLKQLYYKDLNNEFIKHRRMSAGITYTGLNDSFEVASPIVIEEPEQQEFFDSVISYTEAPAPEPVYNEPTFEQLLEPQLGTAQRADIQLASVEPGYLEKRLSFVLEPVDTQISDALREAAHYVTKLFRVPEMVFRSNDDIEAELHYGIIRSREQITTLRSFAWTLNEILRGAGRDMRDVTELDIARAVEIIEDNNRLNYKIDSREFPMLCSMPLDDGVYIPAHAEYLFFAQELMPEVKLGSLFSLQHELMLLAPAMKLSYDVLREQKRAEVMPPRGVLFDTLCAWSAYCFAACEPFEVVEGPNSYNYSQIAR